MKYLVMLLYAAGCVWALSTLESCKPDGNDDKPVPRIDLLTNGSSRAWELEGVRPNAESPEELVECQSDDKMWFAKIGTWRHDIGGTSCSDADLDRKATWAFAEGETAVVIQELGQSYEILRLESRNLELKDARGVIYRYSCGCGR